MGEREGGEENGKKDKEGEQHKTFRNMIAPVMSSVDCLLITTVFS